VPSASTRGSRPCLPPAHSAAASASWGGAASRAPAAILSESLAAPEWGAAPRSSRPRRAARLHPPRAPARPRRAGAWPPRSPPAGGAAAPRLHARMGQAAGNFVTASNHSSARRGATAREAPVAVARNTGVRKRGVELRPRR
jgi:hypothetical protein